MSQKRYDNFNIRINKPLDKRFNQENIDVDRPYEGMFKYQPSDDKYYRYKNGEFEDFFKDIYDIINRNKATNVKDFGAKGDGVTDDVIAIQNALNYAILNKTSLYFPNGIYKCSSKINSVSGNVALIGESMNNVKIVFYNTVGGFDLQLNAQTSNKAPEQLVINNITIETNSTISTPAINAKWNPNQATAMYEFLISNVVIRAKDDGTGTFGSGIKLTNAFNGVINSCLIVGDELAVSNKGIDIVDSVGIRITNTDINRYKTGVSITKSVMFQCEGIFLTNCFIYDVEIGVYVNTAIHIQIINCHVNLNRTNPTVNISFNNVNQSVIADCLLYTGGGTVAGTLQDCIQLINTCTTRVVNNNMICLNANRSRDGILVLGLSQFNLIGFNYIETYPSAIVFTTPNDSSYNQVIGNQMRNNLTAKISDSSIFNYKANNTYNGVPYDGVKWGSTSGNFGNGEISADPSWGAYFKGFSGAVADIALVDSNGNVGLSIKNKVPMIPSFTKGSLPLANTVTNGIVIVTDDVGGRTVAFSDGTNWRRLQDLAIVN